MIDRSTPIGTRVLADVDTYPSGYAWGNPRSEIAVPGTLWAIGGDAGIDWCFARVDNPGSGPEFMHCPVDRVDRA